MERKEIPTAAFPRVQVGLRPPAHWTCWGLKALWRRSRGWQTRYHYLNLGPLWFIFRGRSQPDDLIRGVGSHTQPCIQSVEVSRVGWDGWDPSNCDQGDMS